MPAAAGDAPGCAEEAADLLYHLAVLMEARGFGWDEVVADAASSVMRSGRAGKLHRLVVKLLRRRRQDLAGVEKSSPPRQLPITPPAPATTGISAL